MKFGSAQREVCCAVRSERECNSPYSLQRLVECKTDNNIKHAHPVSISMGQRRGLDHNSRKRMRAKVGIPLQPLRPFCHSEIFPLWKYFIFARAFKDQPFSVGPSRVCVTILGVFVSIKITKRVARYYSVTSVEIFERTL